LKSLSEIFTPFQGERLVEWFSDLIALWHETGPIEPSDRFTPIGMTQWVHYHNFILWHQEDEARRKDVTDKDIAECKRTIDRHNQLRNDGIEQIDVWIDNVLKTAGINPDDNVEVNSETPGSIIDRLSILSLKIYHMAEQTMRDDVSQEHKELSELRLSILQEQRDDLVKALNKLILDLRMAKKRHKVYRQFKMYNDPRFNPALYKRRTKESE